MHAPLFYILLHFWMSIFGNADTTLRILPVIIGILNIPVIYLCGKELKCDKTALLAAFFVAINSLLIYYSQEMRLYSLTALFSSLIILFCLRLHNNPSKLNIIGLTLANIGLLYTHTISFVFVFFEFIVFAVFFWSKNRNSFKLLIISGFATLILYTPLIYKIFNVMKAGINSGITAQWWSTFTFDQILLVLGDSYSPFIVTHKIAPLSYFDFLGDTIHLIVFWAIFGIIPALIGLMGIILSLFNKNPLPKLLLLVCFGFLGVFTIAAIQGKVVYVCRYIIEITPLLLLLTAYGLINKQIKLLSKGLIAIFLAINLFVLTFSPMSTAKRKRPAAYLAIANVLKEHKLNNNDYFIMTGNLKSNLYKYFEPAKSNIFSDINIPNSIYFPHYINGDITLSELTKLYYNQTKMPPKKDIEKIRTKLKEIEENTALYKDFLNHKDNKRYNYERFRGIIGSKSNIFTGTQLKSNIFSKLNNNNRIAIIINRNIASIPNIEEIKLAAGKNTADYQNGNLVYMTHSRIANDLVEYALQELSLIDKIEVKKSEIYIFKAKQ